MGNSKTKQDRNKLSSPESYCFYSANNQEQHVYLKQMDSFLLISHGLGNAVRNK